MDYEQSSDPYFDCLKEKVPEKDLGAKKCYEDLMIYLEA
jgi:hypothetical protein